MTDTSNILRRLALPAFMIFCDSTPLEAQDLGTSAGYGAGSIQSESCSPVGLAWFALPGEGPEGGDCMQSGSIWATGDVSIAQLALTGPGVLGFSWRVSSLADDGILSCQVSQPGGPMEAGAISGVDGGWQAMQVFIPQGPRTVSWIYRKKTWQVEGDDAGRVARVAWTPLPAAAQSFDAWRTAHGLGDLPGQTRRNGRRLDTAWLTDLAPDEPSPADASLVSVSGGFARYRVRYSLSATTALECFHSTDLLSWTKTGSRMEFVPGSTTATSAAFDCIVPAGAQHWFRCAHQPQVAPPSPDCVYIPPGTFLAGSPTSETGRVWTGYMSGNHNREEDLQHSVTLTRGFFLSRYEVTWQEWTDVLAWGQTNGYTIGDGDEARGGRHLLQSMGGNTLNTAPADDLSPQHPASNIGFYDALKWCNARSEKEGLAPCYRVRLRPEFGGGTVIWRNESFAQIGTDPASDLLCDWTAGGYRLPTEAEWEYACRAGTLTSLSNGLNLTHGAHYPFWPVSPASSNLDDPSLNAIATYFGNTGATQPVGSLAPNALGLYDMHGNVQEWCWDLYDSRLPVQFTGEPLTDPRGASAGTARITKGGSWRNPGHMLRSASRNPAPFGGGNSHEAGFRCARTAPE